jgi:hypothetical protein
MSAQEFIERVGRAESTSGASRPRRRCVRGRRVAYDRPVDPITARQVLRISPDAPLTVDLVERAYFEECWARHPSRYEHVTQRREAEQWAGTLATARQVLLQAAATANAAKDVASTPQRNRSLSGVAIAGIVAGGVALLALITFGIIGGANLVTQAAATAQEAVEDSMVDRYQSGETSYAFFAALEIYHDGRYDAQCPIEFDGACWQNALFTEADCETMQVTLAFTDDMNAVAPDFTETIEIRDVVAYEAPPVVYGNQAYGYGWITGVTCLDSP